MAATKSKSARARKPRKSKSKSTSKSTQLAEAPSTPVGAGEPVPVETPVVADAVPESDPADIERRRAEARAERRRLREQRRAQPTPAAIERQPASVVPIDSARKRDAREPILMPLDDGLRWKMEALNLRVERAESAVRAPLVEQLRRIVEQKVAAAIQASPECQKARSEQAECVNAIIKTTTPNLPEGYAVSSIQFERGQIVCEYRPDQVGKLLDVPKT